MSGRVPSSGSSLGRLKRNTLLVGVCLVLVGGLVEAAVPEFSVVDLLWFLLGSLVKFPFLLLILAAFVLGAIVVAWIDDVLGG